jgi:hypothetical protein
MNWQAIADCAEPMTGLWINERFTGYFLIDVIE